MGCCYGQETLGLGLDPSYTRAEMLVRGRKIVIVEGDISGQETDAIVNSTNPILCTDVGDARLIMSRGGVELRADCIALVNERGPVEIGEAVVTKGGELRCLHVIHVVAPVYVTGRRGEREALRTSLLKVLETAEDLKCRSIAIPAISTMPYAYPKAECTSTLIETARTFLITRSQAIESITFVSCDRLTVRYFCRALERVKREECIVDSTKLI